MASSIPVRDLVSKETDTVPDPKLSSGLQAHTQKWKRVGRMKGGEEGGEKEEKRKGERGRGKEKGDEEEKEQEIK